jgi:hypothetical protein
MASYSADLRKLNGTLRGWDAQLRVQESAAWLPRGLLAGVSVALALAIAARFWPLLARDDLMKVSIGLVIAGLVLTLVAVWLWRRSPRQMARRFDAIFGLKERLITAIEAAEGSLTIESAEIARRQLQQTLQSASGVRPGEHLPLRSDWRWWVASGLVVAGLVAAILIPNPQDRVLAQHAEVTQAITQELTKLEQIKKQIEEDPTLTEEQKDAVINKLDETIETLKQPDITQPEALAALDSLEQSLRDQSQQFAAERQQALEQASGLFNDTALQNLAEALQNEDYAAAAEALENLDLDSLTPEQQQQLAGALSQAADALEGSNPELSEQLSQAAESLQNGDTAGAEQALDQAGQQVAQAGESTTQQLDEAADRVGEGGQNVAEAGKQGGKSPGGQPGQPGQGGMGQAPQAGQGAGQMPGQGSSGAGNEPGNGVTQGGQGGQMPTDNGPGDGGEGEYEAVYSPQRIGGEGGENVDVPGDPGAGSPTGAEGDFTENPDGSADVPYNEVYNDYKDAANEAIDAGYIPLGLQELIKQYFTGLAP